MKRKSLLRLSIALGALTAGAQFASAADTQVTQPDSGKGIETIVVTANKRAENVQSISTSVLVATAEVLDRTNVRDFDDLVKIAPSLTITKTTQPANNSINIRGVGTYAYSIATEASTALVVDDVPQAFQAEAFNALTDAAQVEVLRGPQSTLFGKAASAGVINITTKAPTDEFSAGVKVFATDDDEQRAEGFVSGPITDTLKFRLALGADRYKGNLHNIFNNTWVDGHSDVNARAKLVWEPDGDWTITLAPWWDNTRATCCTWAYFAVSPGVTFGKFGPAKFQAPQAAILNGIVPNSNNRLISADVNPKGNATDGGAGFKVERKLGDFLLSSITGYDKYYLHDDQDTDGTSFNWGPGGANVPGAVPGGSANGGWFDVNSLTQELRLTSPDSGRFRYVAGFFFSRTGSHRSYVRGSNSLGQDGTLTTVPPTTSAYATYYARAHDTNYALYAQGTFDITEALNLVGGLRLNEEDISYSFFDRFNNVSYGVPSCSTTTPSGLKASTCNTIRTLSGRAGVQYHVTGDIMVFGTYDRGNKGAAYDLTSTYTTRTPVASGPDKGFPTADAVAAKQPIPAETVDAFQLGMKSEFWDKVIFNVTLFDEIFHHFQAQSRDELTQQNVLNSIGQVTTRGVEMELSAYLDPGLTVSAAGAYDEATIDKFPNAACFSSQTAALGCVGGQQNLSGKPLFDAPKWNFNINGEYDRELTGELTGFVTGSWHWQSSEFHSLLQDPDSRQPAYGVVDVSAGLETGDWKLKFFCNNLFDQNYSLTRGRDGNWNINPYGASPGPITDAIKWTPARDSKRYVGLELGYNY
jgi:iron complex outermembrane receptor protein